MIGAPAPLVFLAVLLEDAGGEAAFWTARARLLVRHMRRWAAR